MPALRTAQIRDRSIPKRVGLLFRRRGFVKRDRFSAAHTIDHEVPFVRFNLPDHSRRRCRSVMLLTPADTSSQNSSGKSVHQPPCGAGLHDSWKSVMLSVGLETRTKI